MTEEKEAKIGIAPEIGGLTGGLTLIIWSIIIAVLAGTDTTGVYQSMLAFSFIFPPLGSYFVVTSAVDILRVIRNEEY